MAETMLGKAVAGVALGGASLLVFTPGTALATGQQDGGHPSGVHTRPDAVRAGDRVTLFQACDRPQEHVFVWSKVTRPVELKPVREQGDGKDSEEEAGAQDPDQRGEASDGRSPDGTDQYPKPPAPDQDVDRDGRGAHEDGWERGKDVVYHGEATVSTNAKPGTYRLKGSCGEGELTVLPTGSVDGGDGGTTPTSTHRGLAAGGAGLLGAAALGGLVLLRRRRADGLV